MNRYHSVVFEISSKYCSSYSFVDHNGYSISSKGFLPAVVDINLSQLNSPIPVHFSSLIPRMSTFTLGICLTTSNLPWFMDLTFQVPIQYCCLQHQTLLLSPVTSTTGYCFYFGSIPSFFLGLFLYWSPVAYWAPTDLGSSSFSILSFCFFILFMRFSRQEYWSGLPFPSPVDHILSDLSTMTRPSWVAPRAWLIFIELDKAVVLVWLDWLVFCEYGFNVFALWCPLATPTVLLGFLFPWAWGISSWLLQQSSST